MLSLMHMSSRLSYKPEDRFISTRFHDRKKQVSMKKICFQISKHFIATMECSFTDLKLNSFSHAVDGYTVE